MNRVRKKSQSPAAAARKKPTTVNKSDSVKSIPSISNKSDSKKSTPRLVRKNQAPAVVKQSKVKFKPDAGTPSTTNSNWAVKSTLDVPNEQTMTKKIMKTIRKVSVKFVQFYFLFENFLLFQMSSAVVSPLDLRSSPAPPPSASAVQHAPKAEQQYTAEEIAEFK